MTSPSISTVVSDPPSAWANADMWDLEYGDVRAIPSSFRLTPSHAFLHLEDALRPVSGAVVLDAGAGTGRHSLYLAKRGCLVHAVDVSAAACDALRTRLSRNPGLKRRIVVENEALGSHELPDSRYDIIIDSYVSCHILSPQVRVEYIDALLGLLRPGGVLYTSHMGSGDEYYSRQPFRRDNISCDPLNGITKLLQSGREFQAEARALAAPTALTAERFLDEVAGSPFRREVLAATLQR